MFNYRSVNKNSFCKYWLLAMLFVITTSFYCFGLIIHAFNVLLILMMVLSSVLIFFITPYLRKSELLFYLLYVFMLMSAFLHFETFRLSTVLYTGLFIVSFLFYNRLLNEGCLSIFEYSVFLKKIIYAFAIVLIIQQFLTITGLPVLNKCWNFSERFKLNSLALEPSYIAGTLLVLMYSFMVIKAKESNQKTYAFKKNIKDDKWVWLSFFYTLLTCSSTYSLLAIFVFILYLSKKYFLHFCAFFLVIASLVFFFQSRLMNIEAFSRLYNLKDVIFSLDTDMIAKTDLSAAARINPIIFYAEDFNLFSKDIWFGKGTDYSKQHIIVRLLGHDEAMEQGNATGGMFPAFFLDYGLICGILFLVILKKITMNRWFSFPLIIWLFFFLAIGFNTYMQWLFILFMSTTKYFENRIRFG